MLKVIGAGRFNLSSQEICYRNYQIVLYYFSALISEKYQDLHRKDKKFLRSTHKHIKECHMCRDGFEFLKKYVFRKDKFSQCYTSNELEQNYTPEKEERLKENEAHLDTLLE